MRRVSGAMVLHKRGYVDMLIHQDGERWVARYPGCSGLVGYGESPEEAIEMVEGIREQRGDERNMSPTEGATYSIVQFSSPRPTDMVWLANAIDDRITFAAGSTPQEAFAHLKMLRERINTDVVVYCSECGEPQGTASYSADVLCDACFEKMWG